MIPGRVAITVLCRAPVPGRVKSRLAAAIGAEAAAALHAAMSLDLLEELTRLGGSELVLSLDGAEGSCRAFEDEVHAAIGGIRVERQGTGDLGDRMAQALGRRLQEGAMRSFVVGTDCLEVAIEIAPACGALEGAADANTGSGAAAAVLVPALDGGFVLLGARRAIPDGVLRGLPWGSPDALEATRAALHAAGFRVHLSERVFDDVDDAAGLLRLRDRLAAPAGAGTPAARRVRALLGT